LVLLDIGTKPRAMSKVKSAIARWLVMMQCDGASRWMIRSAAGRVIGHPAVATWSHNLRIGVPDRTEQTSTPPIVTISPTAAGG
jgi:hypothetical protein